MVRRSVLVIVDAHLLHLRFSSDSDFCLLVADPFGIKEAEKIPCALL